MSQEWHYAHGGVQKGPVTEAQLKALITLGQLLPNGLVWRDGLAEWVKAGTVRELFSAKSALPPPPPPKRPQPPTPVAAAPVPKQSPQAAGSAATPTQPDQSSADWRHQLQTPLVIALSFLFCWPVGLVLIGIHPRISRKTKRIVFGCFASFIVIAMIIAGIASSVAYKQVLEANALWETDKHEEAVAIYKRLVAGESGGILPDSMKPTVYGRLIDHEASSGNVAAATKWIEQAAKFKIAPDARSEEAQRILASFEVERRRKEQLAQTRNEAKPPAAEHAFKQQDAASDAKPRKLGTMQDMGKAFYNGLIFADVAKGQELPNVKLTKDFCPSGQRTYRTVSFDTNTFDASLREQMSSLGYPPTDPVYEKAKNVQYEVTKGEPKNVYDGDDSKMLPLLRIRASPGDEWDWDLGRQPNGDEVRYVFKYVRAVRCSGHDCVLIVCEDHANSGSMRNVTMQRIERWYAEGIGLVKVDEYVLLGDGLTHMKADYLVGD
jgi:hypothetical protein